MWLVRISLHYASSASGDNTGSKHWDVPPDTELDSPNTLALLFWDPDQDGISRFLEGVDSLFPQSLVAGCSTAGEIFDGELREGGVSLALVRFDSSRIKAASARVAKGSDSYEAARAIAGELQADDLKAVFVLSDGLSVNGSELARGFNAVFGAGVVVTGGLAADGARFQHTWTLIDGAPREHQVVAVGLYGGNVRVRHGSKGGWDIFGPDRRVTRSQGNVLYELDGRPALELYKQYLGDKAGELPAAGLLFPLALRDDKGRGERVVRTILAVDEAEQSITFAGDIPLGSMTTLMRANFDRLITGAAEAGEMAGLDVAAEGEALSIAISCVGRRLVLGERTEEEIEATLDVLPPGTRQIGFYSYGELSPLTSGACDLHNQTMTLTVIHEN